MSDPNDAAVPASSDVPAPLPSPEIHMVPCVSASLLLHGQVSSQTSIKGDHDFEPHPLLAAFLRDIPVEHREMFRFNCAEIGLLSAEFTEFEQTLPEGSPLTWDEAVAHCTGGTVFATVVRDPTDPRHGAPAKPCKSCAHLLDALGIEVLES